MIFWYFCYPDNFFKYKRSFFFFLVLLFEAVKNKGIEQTHVIKVIKYQVNFLYILSLLFFLLWLHTAKKHLKWCKLLKRVITQTTASSATLPSDNNFSASTTTFKFYSLVWTFYFFFFLEGMKINHAWINTWMNQPLV